MEKFECPLAQCDRRPAMDCKRACYTLFMNQWAERLDYAKESEAYTDYCEEQGYPEFAL